MEIREIALVDLILDPTLNLRDKLDEFSVERYADAWTRMPPVTVFDVEERWLLADGFHRHAAAVRLGKESIRAEIRQGTFEEALDFVSSVNLFHGLPLTRAERRRAVEIKLRLHHDWSDRRLAEELSIGRELIAKIRKQLVEGGQLPNQAARVGSDGKTYTTAGLPRDPQERRPTRPEDTGRDDPRDRGGREADAAPWDDTVDPMPKVSKTSAAALPPWEDSPSGPRPVSLTTPAHEDAPSIEEMLALMTKQILEVINWSNAEGFTDAYKSASANGRGLFHTACIKLAARADQLRKL
ncbi:MAG: ParB N-terminal domain-containing protein [Isosphaeraceae bacterium]|nr:ParB N-terminal domain-containing protein [Isosphaeraceae bacterium]